MLLAISDKLSANPLAEVGRLGPGLSKRTFSFCSSSEYFVAPTSLSRPEFVEDEADEGEDENDPAPGSDEENTEERLGISLRYALSFVLIFSTLTMANSDDDTGSEGEVPGTPKINRSVHFVRLTSELRLTLIYVGATTTRRLRRSLLRRLHRLCE